jgi:hypothetical protein
MGTKDMGERPNAMSDWAPNSWIIPGRAAGAGPESTTNMDSGQPRYARLPEMTAVSARPEGTSVRQWHPVIDQRVDRCLYIDTRRNDTRLLKRYSGGKN